MGTRREREEVKIDGVCYLNEAKLKAGREVSHSQQSIRSQVETRKGPFIDGTQVFLYLDQEHQYWRASKQTQNIQHAHC